MQNLKALIRTLALNGRDMLPVVLVVVGFQYLIVGKPFAEPAQLLLGACLVWVGLTLFVKGLEMSLFPLGDALVAALTYKGNIALLAAFTFCVGAGSTAAEPALIAVTQEAAAAVLGDQGNAAVQRTAGILRAACALAVGLALTLGAFCVIKGWPTGRVVIIGYAVAVIVALITQSPLTAIAMDAGAAATSAINVPLISSTGVGLASLIKGRNPVLDGFGLAALCSLTPMLVLMLAGGLLV
jgi:hypothetical protein